MYADRVESGARRSVKERLDGSIGVSTRQQRQVTGKRFALCSFHSFLLLLV
jgi:hypothetical protein